MTATESLEAKTSCEPTTGCFLWTGAARGRYPSVYVDKKQHYGHRLALALATGGDRPDMCALHRCDNSMCVNPQHLYWGTHADNQRDTVRRRRWRSHGPLSSETVAEIRRRWAKGEKGRALAAAFCTSTAAISRAVNHKTWRA